MNKSLDDGQKNDQASEGNQSIRNHRKNIGSVSSQRDLQALNFKDGRNSARKSEQYDPFKDLDGDD